MKYLLILLPILLFSSNIIKPDSYSKEGYCIVTSKKQKYLGLLRFNTKEEFQKHCNGKMIFKYKNKECRTFTMQNMKFDIFISDEKEIYPFKIGEKRTLCSKVIIESVNK